ncbi:APC family permease [Agromyces tardus]|uniref:APC family permease n=1 Tax=Agromyces tardus TaxID=2583849 RepID=A0A3M8AFX7_9MICO|nr:APC family permease [Agromyces tardus]RNB50088.1 APC family permease [Agromyces tardus]
MSVNEATPLPAVAAESRPGHSTALREGAVGVLGILFFVLSAQAPLTGIAGALPLTIFLGNGAGAPGAYLVIGVIIVIFAIGFIAMSRRVDAKGAFYAYVTAGLGRRTGTGSAWLALVAYATVQAAMYGLYGASVSGLFAAIGLTIPWWIPVVVTIAVVQLLGSLNIELGARVLAILVGLEVAILLAFAFGTLFTGGGPSGSIDFAASFSPAAIMSGAPGVALMFAVASMFGFESTAIYSGEAKDPKRTVARATYLSVAVISIFFSFVSWMFISFYGADDAVAAAEEAVTSGDSTGFVFQALEGILGGWSGLVASILLVTSLFAGILAFHNGINRYLHALGSQRSLPTQLARTNRHKAPHAAAWVQSIIALLLVAPFAIFNLDPILTLFSWFSGLAVAALVALYVLCSVAVVVYAIRERASGFWQMRIAPALAAVLLLGVLALVISNFTSLIGGDIVTAVILLTIVPIAFLIGFITERRPGELLAADSGRE